MARHFDNEKSVQAQLDEVRELKARVKALEDEMKTYMDDNGLEVLKGESTCYKKTWVNDTLIFDTTKFKADHADLYKEYNTKEKAGYYRYNEAVNK